MTGSEILKSMVASQEADAIFKASGGEDSLPELGQSSVRVADSRTWKFKNQDGISVNVFVLSGECVDGPSKGEAFQKSIYQNMDSDGRFLKQLIKGLGATPSSVGGGQSFIQDCAFVNDALVGKDALIQLTVGNYEIKKGKRAGQVIRVIEDATVVKG